MSSPHLHITETLGPTAGALVADAAARITSERGRCVLAVSGGSTPAPVFRWLAEHLDEEVHQRLVVTFVDERHLPFEGDDWSDLPADSNTRLAWEHWFRQRMPQVLRWAVHGTLDEARHQLEARLQSLGGVDLTLLGAGPDGHVASLFPGHDLSATDAVVAVRDAPKPPPERLSLSLGWLQTAQASVLVASGAAKAPVLSRAWRGDPQLPLTLARPAGPYHWVLDAAAASLLQESP